MWIFVSLGLILLAMLVLWVALAWLGVAQMPPDSTMLFVIAMYLLLTGIPSPPSWPWRRPAA